MSSRHGRRAPRSALSGPVVRDPYRRTQRFAMSARAVVEYLLQLFPEKLRGVDFRVQAVPPQRAVSAELCTYPDCYDFDRKAGVIVFYRVPIERTVRLHVLDAEHRRMFIEHCVYMAVCDYLGCAPWELVPGRFDHF